MNNQKLIIYDFPVLFKVLDELKFFLNFDVISTTKEEFSKIQLNIINSHLVVSKNEIPNIKNQFIFNRYPITLTKLIENLNINFLKQKFSEQSEINVGVYKIDMNSKEIKFENKKVKLTEKEMNIIIFLSTSKIPITINELQLQVWGHHIQLETHTVETHVYRLRKKILKVFDDNNFIISLKNGYQIIK
ncbi:winged helix-turn-helix domain-containing protein [Candidatus Pelagibacter ubique]|nr:winged helix-turn-helix domain-containing protein [Candidatus Pelagibacter ubique]